MCKHPDLGATSYPRPCTDVNADGVPKLQCYQDNYMTHCTKNWLKKAIHILALKSLTMYNLNQ